MAKVFSKGNVEVACGVLVDEEWAVNPKLVEKKAMMMQHKCETPVTVSSKVEEFHQAKLDPTRHHLEETNEVLDRAFWVALCFLSTAAVAGLVVIAGLVTGIIGGQTSSPGNDRVDNYDREGYYSLLVEQLQLQLVDSGSRQDQALEWMAFEDIPLEDAGANRLKQRFALAVWYFGQGGPTLWGAVNDNPSAGWINHGADMHECDWKGIDCNPEEEVVAVRLGTNSGIRMTGASLSTELGLLSQLEYLDIARHRLQGSLPDEWKRLTKLVTLSISNNMLSSTLPAWIGELSLLQTLKVDNNQFTGSVPGTYSKLASLEHLDLQGNVFMEGKLEEFLPSMESMQAFDMSMTSIGGTLPTNAAFGRMLKSFQTKGAPIEGPIPSTMGQLSNLERLVIGGSHKLTGTLPTELGLLSNLEDLQINDAEGIREGRLPTEFGALTKLTNLEIGWANRNGTLPVEYKQLSNLVSMSIRNNPLLTGTIPSEYSRLTSLKSLVLVGNTLTGSVGAEVCGLNLPIFETDCMGSEEIDCICCTVCVDP